MLIELFCLGAAAASRACLPSISATRASRGTSRWALVKPCKTVKMFERIDRRHISNSLPLNNCKLIK
eukprot:6201783-Pleurochrysis_carterae.AAC.1